MSCVACTTFVILLKKKIVVVVVVVVIFTAIEIRTLSSTESNWMAHSSVCIITRNCFGGPVYEELLTDYSRSYNLDALGDSAGIQAILRHLLGDSEHCLARLLIVDILYSLAAATA